MDEFLRFEGIDGKEAEEFVRAVRIQAFKAQKLKDNEWIAMLASTAFAGPALRWYGSLSPEVRDNWDALQVAILSKYSVDTPASGPMASIPDAAAAPPPLPPKASASPWEPCTGRIRITGVPSKSSVSYLSKPSATGILSWEEDVSDALIVTKLPNSAALQILDDSTEESFVGAQFWDFSPDDGVLGKGHIGLLALTVINKTKKGFQTFLTYDSGQPVKGYYCTDLWEIGTSKTLLALLAQDGVEYSLQALAWKWPKRDLGLCSDPATSIKAYNPNTVVPVSLSFEPL